MKFSEAELAGLDLSGADFSGCFENYPFRKGFVFLSLLLLFFLFPAQALGINAPTITRVHGIAVSPNTTIYAGSRDPLFEGNAEGGTEIRLFRGTTQIATGTTSAVGVWSVSLSNHAEGSFSFSARAHDGLFISESSVSVQVVVDVTIPAVSVQYGHPGCRSNQKYQCLNIDFIRFVVTDPLAGVDFSTAEITVDYSDVPSTGDPDHFNVVTWTGVPGSVDNNGINQVNFYPSSGFGVINQSFRKIRISARISDRAGNFVSRTASFYNNSPWHVQAPIIEKIWDPGHNQFTGTNEPTTNLLTRMVGLIITPI